MPTRVLTSEPNVLPLYAKAVLPGLPVVGRLPGIRHSSDSVPDLTLARTEISTDTARLAAYARVCGFDLPDRLPATYPHLPTFGLQMTLMCDPAFPFAPMGLVHISNTITQYRPIAVTERYDVQVHAENLRRHPRGKLVDLTASARVGEETVWAETSTYLARGKHDDSVGTESVLANLNPPSGSTRWQLDGDLGRRYAAVSGDRNPIHLYRLTAKALGFPRQIAHGMWTKARCLAALGGRLPDAYRVDVEFKKPILLPGTVRFGSELGEQESVFAVTGDRASRTHLIGRIRSL